MTCQREHQRGDGQKPRSASADMRRSFNGSVQLSAAQKLEQWAAAAAATLPPLTDSQVAAVARIVAHLDASENQEPAA